MLLTIAASVEAVDRRVVGSVVVEISADDASWFVADSVWMVAAVSLRGPSVAVELCFKASDASAVVEDDVVSFEVSAVVGCSSGVCAVESDVVDNPSIVEVVGPESTTSSVVRASDVLRIPLASDVVTSAEELSSSNDLALVVSTSLVVSSLMLSENAVSTDCKWRLVLVFVSACVVFTVVSSSVAVAVAYDGVSSASLDADSANDVWVSLVVSEILSDVVCVLDVERSAPSVGVATEEIWCASQVDVSLSLATAVPVSTGSSVATASTSLVAVPSEVIVEAEVSVGVTVLVLSSVDVVSIADSVPALSPVSVDAFISGVLVDVVGSSAE